MHCWVIIYFVWCNIMNHLRKDFALPICSLDFLLKNSTTKSFSISWWGPNKQISFTMCLFNKWLQITNNILKHSWLICLKFVCHFLAALYYLILKSAVLLRFSQTCEFWSSKAAFTIAFFVAVNHLNGPLRKQNHTITGSRGHDLWFVDFDPFGVFVCFTVRCL